MIKAIAFDLIGVIVTENDVPLTETETVLESRFGQINFDAKYYSWAEGVTGLKREELENLVEGIAIQRYTIPEPIL